jgi:LmbE family N-acetylglucosaminyl deacetylase
MQRRHFLSLLATPLAAQRTDEIGPGPVFVERNASGKPHAGKVLAVIQPHSDDIPLFAAGTVAKLLHEGYTGYLIRVTNDDMAGPGTYAETVTANERDNDEVCRVLGLKRNFNLNYGNHRMDEASRPELKARFIYLFRLLKADTVVCYDPWSHYEENPDHYVTAACVEAACWMAGGSKDYPEHFAGGLKPHSVREKYYFGRFSQRVNRVVDISDFVEKKIDSNLVNLAQGPAGRHGSQLRAQLTKEGRRLPLLGSDDRTADREYIREFILRRDREWGKKHGVAYAEPYYYIGPQPNEVEEYLQKHAVPAR